MQLPCRTKVRIRRTPIAWLESTRNSLSESRPKRRYVGKRKPRADPRGKTHTLCNISSQESNSGATQGQGIKRDTHPSVLCCPLSSFGTHLAPVLHKIGKKLPTTNFPKETETLTCIYSRAFCPSAYLVWVCHWNFSIRRLDNRPRKEKSDGSEL